MTRDDAISAIKRAINQTYDFQRFGAGGIVAGKALLLLKLALAELGEEPEL